MEKELFSTLEIARMLGISRIAVFKKIKAGEIKAKKVGRSFVIHRNDIPEILGTALSDEKKMSIERAVRKTVHEYGETLRLLGKE